MAEIKLYLDEDISHTVAEVLRSRGYDVISDHEVGMRSKTDDDKRRLKPATTVTYNIKSLNLGI